MGSFIKIYSGYISDIENEVNEYARKKHLNIVSSSMAINQGKIFLTVVYEKPCIELRKKAETEAKTDAATETKSCVDCRYCEACLHRDPMEFLPKTKTVLFCSLYAKTCPDEACPQFERR